MELGDLLRHSLLGDPALVRETAAAIDTEVARALELRADLASSGKDGDPGELQSMLDALDAEIAAAQHQHVLVETYARRLQAQRGDIDQLVTAMNAEHDDLALLPVGVEEAGDARPWWAWPWLSTALFAELAEWDETWDVAPLARMDAVALAVAAWRRTDRDRLDAVLRASGGPAGDLPPPSTASSEDLLRSARLGTSPDGSADGDGLTAVAGVLGEAERAATLVVSTPDGLVVRQAWTSRHGALVATADGSSDVWTMVEPDAIATAFAVLVGLGDAADEPIGAPRPDDWEKLVDRDTVEDLLSPDGRQRERSIEELRRRVAGVADAPGPWRAWCATVIRPRDGVVDGASIIVLDTPAGHLLAHRWGDSAALRPVDVTTVGAALGGLTSW